jgi:hypothetical protein
MPVEALAQAHIAVVEADDAKAVAHHQRASLLDLDAQFIRADLQAPVGEVRLEPTRETV